MVEYCVCAEPIEERGVYDCRHALCLSCTLKKRVLMKDNHCPYCRSPSKQVAIVSSGATDIADARTEFQPGNLKVENSDLTKQLRHILSFPCPECDEEMKSYKHLRPHVQKEHGLALCDVCTKHEYNFSDEYRLFDPGKIRDHLKKQHIFCKYCHSYFYGNTEFSQHCREKHIGCGICERRNPENPQYFKEYDQLFEHYKAKHHLCMVPTCLENKHIVFGTALELRRHMVEAHRGLISNAKQSQQIDLEQLSQDAEEAQASTANGRQSNSTHESERSRYEARLSISAQHDEDKISKLHGANSTFLSKKVPVEIFIATYESILKSTPKAEVTALLTAFRRVYKPDLSEDVDRTLGFKLAQRSKAEADEEAHQSSLKYQSAPNNDDSKHAKPISRGPVPTDVHRINWGYNVPASSMGNLSNLPALGGNSSRGTNSPARTSSPAATWRPQKPTASSGALQNLPTLAKKPKPPSSRLEALSVRQTSIPLGNNGSGQSRFYSSLRSAASSSAGSSPVSSSGPPSPASGSHVQSVSASSSSTSLSTRSSGGQRNVQLNNLPALPGKKSEGANKKRQKNVLRIV